MTRRALAAVLPAAILVIAACGETKEEQRVDFVRDTCAAVVPGTTLYRDALISLGFGELRNRVCVPANTLAPEGADDACNYGEAICQDDLIYVARDDRACSGGPGGGCIYGCVLRVSQALLAENENTVRVCGRFFYGPQACSAVAPVICE